MWRPAVHAVGRRGLLQPPLWRGRRAVTIDLSKVLHDSTLTTNNFFFRISSNYFPDSRKSDGRPQPPIFPPVGYNPQGDDSVPRET